MAAHIIISYYHHHNHNYNFNHHHHYLHFFVIFTTINRFARFTRITRFTRSTKIARFTRITRITFLNFPQLFSTFLNLKQILMQNSHSLLRSSWPIFSLGMTLLSVLYSWWDCGGMKFKTSDRCNLFSCTQHFHFCQWNGKQNDKRLKTYWWDYGGMNGCYHVFPKFTFWSRNNDDSKKSRGVDGRGLWWQQVGLIPPIFRS